MTSRVPVRKHVLVVMVVSNCIIASAIGQSPASQPVRPGVVEPAGGLWKIMRRADSDSPELQAARKELLGVIAKATPKDKAAIAVRLMDAGAGESTNAAALDMLGKDPVGIEDVRSMLFNPVRSRPQRLFLETYYSLCRGGDGSDALSQAMALKLVDILAGRMEKLAGQKPPYGEQRLMVHLCASVLSRFAYSDQSAREVQRFFDALRLYAGAAPKSEPLGAAIRGWLSLRGRREGLVAGTASALAALGHWNPLIRWKASAMLGKVSASDPNAIRQAWTLLDDPRDEVRAAAARVFVFASQGNPGKVVPRMVRILTSDRGVVVQAAAAEVLAAYAQGTKSAIQPLLAAFDRRIRPGRKRTSSILLALSHLLVNATARQKKRILELAVANLRRSPAGALAALKALGTYARPAVGAIRNYRGGTDRFRRQYINQHVLPAITQQPTRG